MSRSRGKAGFTIIEALVTITMFTLFMGILFATLSYGFRTYSVALARSDVTTEARRLVLFLENELRSSAYFSIAVQSRVVSGLHRDGFSFVTMRDWSREEAYDPIESQPNWDLYMIYYATQELPTGRLVRMVIEPDPGDVGSFPYSPFSNTAEKFMLNDPSVHELGSELINARVLASKVKSFEVTLLPVTQEVDVSILLRQNGIMSQRADRTREGGTFELNYRVKPQNTK